MSDPYYNPPSPSAPPASTMAIIALIAGILGLTIFPLLGSIVAVIVGPMAKKEIIQSGGTLGGDGLAQIGTILGWIGLGLALIGCCVTVVLVGLPFLLIPLGLATEGYGMVLPLFLIG